MNDFNFNKILFKYYKTKYKSIKNFELIHELLETNDISDKDKLFYLENKIPIFGINDRNSFLIRDFYYFYDHNEEINNLYINFMKNIIQPLFPNENNLVIQKTPNIRFHLPNCSNIGKRDSDIYDEFIGVHTDSEAGHPNEEINLVIAINDMFDTNSIYYEKEPNMNIELEQFNNLKLKTNEYFIYNFNQCRHYNKINKTNQTRVSLDIRFIPYSKYISYNNNSLTSNKKFVIGDYYILV